MWMHPKTLQKMSKWSYDMKYLHFCPDAASLAECSELATENAGKPPFGASKTRTPGP